jgi:hypothetical protein
MFDRNFVDGHYILTCGAPGTAVAADPQYYPPSGSFIDMMDYSRGVFMVKVGTLTSALVGEIFQDTSATATASLKALGTALDTDMTIAATDDQEVYVWEFTQEMMDGDGGFRYVTWKVTGAAGGDDYVDVFFFGVKKGSVPVTQPSTDATNKVTSLVYTAS